ncbi:MAG: excinuclease subunit [Patescibacteria group bacterium]|nr:excinuclease subunit [Patescibacteria group bacterium]
MKSQDLPQLKDNPGVYLFLEKEKILYIGKATSLRDRVKSYFGNDLLNTRGPMILDMVTKSDKLNFFETDSVLEALILEANLIKKYQPVANTREKDNKSFYFVIVTKDETPKVLVMREREIEKLGIKTKAKFGPFPNGSVIREAIRIIRRIFPFQDENSLKKDQKEFYRQLGLSPDFTKKDFENVYEENISNLILFFKGKKRDIVKKLEKEMMLLAKAEKFEKANDLKKKIFALNHIKDVSLIKKENTENREKKFRIEAYDISHMSGNEMVGVMTVVTNGAPDKAEYRKFKIKGFDRSNDVGALNEVLLRRFGHTEWLYPNMIVVDGSVAQKRTAEKVLNNIGAVIPVVAVVKDERHRPKQILGSKDYIQGREDAIILANSESHRFSIKYHKDLRNKNFIPKRK